MMMWDWDLMSVTQIVRRNQKICFNLNFSVGKFFLTKLTFFLPTDSGCQDFSRTRNSYGIQTEDNTCLCLPIYLDFWRPTKFIGTPNKFLDQNYFWIQNFFQSNYSLEPNIVLGNKFFWIQYF